MGVKLLKIYEEINQSGGLQAKMRLALMTNISSVQSEKEPDSDENLEKFRKAFKEIIGREPSLDK